MGGHGHLYLIKGADRLESPSGTTNSGSYYSRIRKGTITQEYSFVAPQSDDQVVTGTTEQRKSSEIYRTCWRSSSPEPKRTEGPSTSVLMLPVINGQAAY